MKRTRTGKRFGAKRKTARKTKGGVDDDVKKLNQELSDRRIKECLELLKVSKDFDRENEDLQKLIQSYFYKNRSSYVIDGNELKWQIRSHSSFIKLTIIFDKQTQKYSVKRQRFWGTQLQKETVEEKSYEDIKKILNVSDETFQESRSGIEEYKTRHPDPDSAA